MLGMSAVEKQTIDILSRLNDTNKSFVLDFVRFIEQKQLSDINDINYEEFADDESVKKISDEFIEQYLDAFKELAK